MASTTPLGVWPPVMKTLFLGVTWSKAYFPSDKKTFFKLHFQNNFFKDFWVNSLSDKLNFQLKKKLFLVFVITMVEKLFVVTATSSSSSSTILCLTRSHLMSHLYRSVRVVTKVTCFNQTSLSVYNNSQHFHYSSSFNGYIDKEKKRRNCEGKMTRRGN